MKQRLKKHGLWLGISISILILSVVLVDLHTWRTVLVVPFVLFLPGFALSSILFKRNDLRLPERLLLSVGLSVALTALIGLVLNWTPWGLTTKTLWIAFLIVLAVEMVLILLFRRPRWADLVSLSVHPNFSAREWLLLSFAALVTLTALYIARTPVPQQGFEGYTTLWVQPSERPDMFRLGVRSDEFETTKYKIRIEHDGTVHEGPTLELKPGETWEAELGIQPSQLGDKQLTVLLYRLDHPTEIYRHVVLWPE